jgi:3'-phosphoadenosine 5'-phosphosulfate sulfotransferase (PAPS reductase)/FAD synthetase
MYKYIASISFGKDSLAMLLLLIRNRYTLDEVIFYDTGMEFQAIYDTRDIIKGLLHKLNIKYTELKPEIPFIDKMLNIEVHKRDGSIQFGYGLCGGRCRWGTTEKNKTIERYLKEQYGQDYKEFIGIAYDEQARIEKERNGHKLLPLVDWKMTEQHCLEYCYNSGFYWEENGVKLYDVLDRVSCWCCGNKNKKELENMRLYLPEYYLKYIDLLKKIKKNNKKGIVVDKAKEQFMKLF